MNADIVLITGGAGFIGTALAWQSYAKFTIKYYF